VHVHESVMVSERVRACVIGVCAGAPVRVSGRA
jgi:hypothetical protein